MDEELLAKLGVDASGVRKGVDSALNALGDLETVGGSAVARFVSAASKPLNALDAALTTTARNTSASAKAIGAQNAEFVKLESGLKRASDAYTTFLRAQATGGGPAGKGIASYSLQQLDQFRALADAAKAGGAQPNASTAFMSAVNAEITARRRANEQMVVDDKRFNDQLAAQADEGLLVRVKQASNERVAFEAKIHDQLLEQDRKFQAQRIALAEKEAAEQQRIAQALAGQQGSRTVATSPYVQLAATGRSLGGSYYGMPASGTLATSMSGVGNGSNTAALNTSTTANEQAWSAEQLAKMRDYYSNEEQIGLKAEAAARGVSLFGVHIKDSGANLPRLRYALYDVSTSLSLATAGFIAQGIAIFKTNIEYEALFASVARTSGLNPSTAAGRQQIDALRASLVNLTTQIPVTFADVTKIATLAGQLGIAADQIAPFTRVVAEFSATTNVSVDAAATAFGRLSQIIIEPNGTRASVAAMADEIAYLGVKSVATESQIIGVASQIAVSTNMARMGSQATLALATALASVGVKQEAARGTFIRTFGAIDAAVRQPGKALNDLAAISGSSSAQFAHDWETNSSGAFRRFVAGLGTSNASIKANLADLHITAARDVQTLSLLAQNTDLVDQSFRNAADAAGYLEKAFAQQTNTVAGRLTLLQSTIAATFDNIGASANGPLTLALNGVLALVRGLDNLTKNPAQAFLLAAAAAVATLGVAAIALGGILIRVLASYLAVAQAADTMNLGENRLAATLLRLIGITTTSTAANLENAASNEAQAASSGNLSGKLATTTSSAGRLTGALGKAGLVGTLIVLGLALPSIIQAMADWSKTMLGITPDVDTLTQKILGLTDASAKAGNLAVLQKGLSSPGGTQGDVSGRVGGNYAVQLDSGGTRQINAYQGASNELSTGQRTPGGNIDFYSGGGSFNAEVDTAKSQIQNYDAAISSLISSGHLAAAKQGVKVFVDEMKQHNLTEAQATALLGDSAKALGLTGTAGLQAAIGLKATADAAAAAGAAFTDTLQAVFGQGISDEKVSGDLASLGQAIQSTGAQAALNGQAISTALADIYAAKDDPKIAAANMLGLADGLVKAGLASKAEVQNIVNAARALDPLAQATGSYADAVVAAHKKAADAAAASATSTQNSVTKTVRTLTDYSSDLSSAFSRAFEFRTGDQTALDAITKGYADLKTQAADAATNLTKVRAELAVLNATRSTLQYQAGVASEYGDTLRGGVIAGQLATNTTDIAAKKKEEATAQAAASRALTGNSAAAIDNRSKLLALVQTGQQYLVTLASNGASQATLTKEASKLKAQFVDQATSMGYNRTEVTKLAASFDDFRAIIRRIPRNVNVKVTANTNPAQAAIDEFLAKNKNLTINTVADKKAATTAGSDIVSSVQAGINQGLQNQQAKNQTMIAQHDATTSGYAAANAKAKAQQDPMYGLNHSPFGQFLREVFGTGSGTRSSGTVGYNGYAIGGYTGDVSAGQIAGFVHGREYVLNERATKMIPRQVLDSWNQGQSPVIPSVVAKVSGGGGNGGSVLSRDDRAFLAAALTRAPAVAISADQFGKAIDGAFVRAGQRGSA